jgi:hypothetical protein
MAALFFRAFWPASVPSAALGVPGVALYLWLGLAMSGPVILLRKGCLRRGLRISSGECEVVVTPTWAEWAWLWIGTYWIVLGLLVIPSRLHGFKFSDAALFALLPIAAALAFRLFAPMRVKDASAMTAWTHGAAVSLLATWPVAWVCLILLGESHH